MPPLTLVVAATLQNGIGHAGRLPWTLPREMAYFVKVTTAAPEGHINACIMGRKSWESIPPRFRPLKGRCNVVVSRQEGYELGVQLNSTSPTTLSPSFETALSSLSSLSSSSTSLPSLSPTATATTTSALPPIHRAFLIGGATLYEQALELPETTHILLTRVLSPAYECDVFLPDFANANTTKGGKGAWRRAGHAELEEWVGFEVPEGVQEEKGAAYEFQMWVRDSVAHDGNVAQE
ncbi:hypothetical protein BOTBODRAFT_47681 [Botryobasidium botryosum FD-172 SS1]|uniref:Dihydrofolate reductase n=1 Tax=Botryobasidium botryosum (strain FD-172 SS1) TaxID=930990 RepID=A0A067M128_BOTB1|nr:hypothetical protein BOTBODRAFT_47681 [Botryobasidium botryosum FD-172 SS1]